MYVDDLSLTDFRSYGSVTVDLEPGVTVFVGRNGQGKTNLAEALGYVATLGSHRVATDAPLVRRGAARAVVRATVVHESRRLLVELEIAPGAANRARLGGAPVGRPRDVLGALRTVLFAPEDLALVKGDPSERRRFLDDLLTQRTPRMAGVKADVERVLKQRNALLKSARSTRGRSRDDHVTSTLDVWDEQLSRLGAELLAERLATLDALAPRMAAAYATVAPEGGDAVVEYRASWSVDDPPRDRAEIADRLSAALTDARHDELERGLTLVGPHRDDLVLTLGGLPAKGYASHGESWSLALALRLASFDLLRSDDRPGGDPVLVLDDVFAELDQARRERLALAVCDAEQVLVTAAVDDDVPTSLHGRRFRVADGTVVAE